MDTENKELWYSHALKWEKYFCDKIAPLFDIKAIINPEKEDNPTAIDLIIKSKKEEILTELKPQFTPFFMSKELYKIENNFAFAFNVKDYEEYKQLNNDEYIIFWLYWIYQKKEINNKKYRIIPMCGLWACKIKTLIKFIDNNNIPVHEYKRRIDDIKGNAKNSFIFDVRNFNNIPFAPVI